MLLFKVLSMRFERHLHECNLTLAISIVTMYFYERSRSLENKVWIRVYLVSVSKMLTEMCYKLYSILDMKDESAFCF